MAHDNIAFCMDKQKIGPRMTEQRPTSEQLWQSLRDQFAGKQQSINEFQAADLIEQWLMTQHRQEIQAYQKRLEEHPSRAKTLRQVIQEALVVQRQSNWLIKQRYSYEHASLITQKVKEIYENTINLQQESDQGEEKPNTQQQIQESRQIQVKSNEVAETEIQRTSSQRVIRLPEIRPRGKIYNPQDMASSFHLRQEAIQQYQPRSPHLFQKENNIKAAIKEALYSNKYLKMAFERFCKQTYNYRGLIGSQFRGGDKMNLNKWMVFCKQFDFTEKFHSKHLIQIYQQATKFASTMDINQFLIGVGLLQQKYIDKFHTGQRFVEEVLKINSQAAFRVKMQNLKVRYGGPTRNSFEMGTYPQHLRMEQMEREKQFKAKKKERDIVLIKGMYQQHLKAEVERLRVQRQKDKLSRSIVMGNRSLVEDKQIDHTDKKQVKISKIHRPEGLNYAKMFQIKTQSPRKTGIFNQERPQENSSMYMTERPANKPQIKQKILESTKTQQLIPKQRYVDAPQRQWITEDNKHTTWLTHIRSDSEESDEIFKEHLQIQKKIQKSRESLRVKHIRKQMQQQSANVEKMLKEMQQDNDMAETGSYFRPKHKNEIFT